MEKTLKQRTIIKILSLFLAFAVIFGAFGSLNLNADAASDSDELAFAQKIDALSKTFRNGEYWSHGNGTLDQTGPIPCDCEDWGGSTFCGYTCGVYFENGYYRSYECEAYVETLGYKVFGGSPYAVKDGWEISQWTSLDQAVYAGDLIKVFSGGGTHWIFVYKVSGDDIYYTDCNWPTNTESGRKHLCQVNWGIKTTKSDLFNGYSLGPGRVGDHNDSSHRYKIQHFSGNTCVGSALNTDGSLADNTDESVSDNTGDNSGGIFDSLAGITGSIMAVGQKELEFSQKIDALHNTFKNGEYLSQANGTLDRTGSLSCDCDDYGGGTFCGYTCVTYFENGYYRSYESEAYVEKLAYSVFGGSPYAVKDGWEITYLNSEDHPIYAGDLIKTYVNGQTHWIFIYKVDGNNITYTDCAFCPDGNHQCKVTWGISTTKSDLLNGVLGENRFGNSNGSRYRYKIQHFTGNTCLGTNLNYDGSIINTVTAPAESAQPTVNISAEEQAYAEKINALRATFRNGEYWSKNNPSLEESGPNPCDNNDKCGVFSSDGARSYQCQGYAEMMGHKIFGGNASNSTGGWFDIRGLSMEDFMNYDLCAGDLLYLKTSQAAGSGQVHVVFVYKVENDGSFYFTDCNFHHTCDVQWGIKTAKTGLFGNGYIKNDEVKYITVSHFNGNTLKGTAVTEP